MGSLTLAYGSSDPLGLAWVHFVEHRGRRVHSSLSGFSQALISAVRFHQVRMGSLLRA